MTIMEVTYMIKTGIWVNMFKETPEGRINITKVVRCPKAFLWLYKLIFSLIYGKDNVITWHSF